MTDSAVTVHIFVDANIVLHYKRVDQIDWYKIIEAKEIVLIFAPVFFRELEKQKIFNPSRKLRERAAEYVKWFGNLLETDATVLNNRVGIRLLTNEPQVDFFGLKLSEAVADDQLIASAIEYQENEHGSIFIVTADVGMRVKLRGRGLGSLKLADDLQLPSELDQDEKELRELRRENEILKNLQPKLKVSFINGGQNLMLPHQTDEPDWLEFEMYKVKAKRPYIRVTERPNFSNLTSWQFSFDLISNLELAGVNPQQITEYNLRLDDFFKKCKFI